MTTARMTGKDDDHSNYNDDSEDNSHVGIDDNNDGSNDNSGGGGDGGGNIGGQVGGVARSLAWLVAMFFTVGCLAFTYRRNCTDTFGNLFGSKFYSGCPDTPHKFYFILYYLDRI